MQKFFWSTCLAALVCFSASSLQAQTPVQQGTVKGGIAGAIIGGIIGHQNDETGEGVAIGAAVGALAGNVVGRSQQTNAIQEQQYRAQLYQQEQLRRQQAQESLNRAVSLNDAIELTRSGLSDSLIITQVHNNGVQQKIGVSEVIALHQNGVSEQVIQAMQSAPIGQASVQLSHQFEPAPTHVVTPVLVQPAPRVIVHSTPVYGRPVYSRGHSYSRGPSYHGRPKYPPNRSARSNSGIRIGF